MKSKPLTIGNTIIQPGERVTLGLPTPELSTYTSMHIPIHVIHGKKEGPCLLVCSAMHGDEMNGIAIIHKLLNTSLLKTLRGTLIAVPAINVYGLLTLSRNLPDRRDLEASFPGSERGSFAARLAHYFTQEILSQATHCIDIHTGDPYQISLPQIQTDLDHPESERIAKAFQPFVLVHTKSQEGLLQVKQEIPTLVYEAGEPLRLDDRGIRIGFRGILRVMRALDMLKIKGRTSEYEPVVVRTKEWLRAPGSGLCQLFKKIGSFVKKGELLADIYDPFGTSQKFQIHSPATGIIVTQSTLPLINEGDPIVHLATTNNEVVPDMWEQRLDPYI